MIIVKNAAAGTLESSDAYVAVSPCIGLTIEIRSAVYAQYGLALEKTVRDTAKGLGLSEGHISVDDRGAVDCVVAARVETAIKRGGGEKI